MSTSFRKIGTESFELKQVQENIEQTFKSVLSNPLLDGVLLSDIGLTTGSPNMVEHKLGRQPLGYIVVKRSAAATISDVKSEKVVEQNFLKLNTSTNVTISLWVF